MTHAVSDNLRTTDQRGRRASHRLAQRSTGSCPPTTTMPFRNVRSRWQLWLGVASVALIAGCSDADLDLRDLGNGFDTSEAALSATADRPEPDNRGIISYPGYQVAVARRGDTVADVATRIGLPADELARFNGAPVDATLNRGEVLALPRRVSEPSPATGSATTGPIRPASEVDVAVLAGDAIDRAEGQQTIQRSSGTPAVQTGEEPVRHQVKAGETAFSIARRYSVSVAALGEWNGLDREYTVRTDQYLMIPPAAPGARAAPAAEAAPTAPGAGSPTPTPPSAAEPLPEDAPSAAAGGAAAAAAAADPVPESPNLAGDRTSASASEAVFVLPVNAPIVAEFRAGEREGISFNAAPGTDVRVAGNGRIRTITEDTLEDPNKEARVVIVTHDNRLSTIYLNVANLSVSEGDSVRQGASIGKVGDTEPSIFQFQVREGASFNAVDPNDYLQ